jgi:hypothetical protein
MICGLHLVGYIMFEGILYRERGGDSLEVIENYEEMIHKIFTADKNRFDSKYRSIVSISIDDIRTGGVIGVANKLSNLMSDSIVIVNAVHYHDLNTFTMGALQVL